ncbi:hypothetical protein Ciccas_007343 [Cichlidogyrus casuarinus]|uniref:Uncharacterized protein n=1 Tax=Cichlidogyrus casuarinus TaxID=1844966 RepID=A0ABD2Q4I5_9PLAT
MTEFAQACANIASKIEMEVIPAIDANSIPTNDQPIQLQEYVAKMQSLINEVVKFHEFKVKTADTYNATRSKPNLLYMDHYLLALVLYCKQNSAAKFENSAACLHDLAKGCMKFMQIIVKALCGQMNLEEAESHLKLVGRAIKNELMSINNN